MSPLPRPSADPPTAALPSWTIFLGTLLLAAGVIVIRRWPQFAEPAIWIEDANTVLPDLIEHGWRGIVHPTGGYLIIPSKLVSYLALRLSFANYAALSTWMATAVQAACVATVAIAPTALRWRFACALATVLVPTGVEVFAIPLHTFWWTSLLVWLALLWRADASPAGRLACLIVGGISSPMVTTLMPMFLLRAIVRRTRRETIVCAVALALGALQGAILATHGGRTASILTSLALPAILVPKYLGTAIYPFDLHGARLLGWMVAAVLGLGTLAVPREERLTYVLLGLCLCAAIGASIARVPVREPHPLLAGPRYFFYPTVITLWMLIWHLAGSSRALALGCAVLIGAYLPALAVDFAYAAETPRKPWPRQVRECADTAGPYTFEAQFDASWNITLSGTDCRALLERSLIR